MEETEKPAVDKKIPMGALVVVILAIVVALAGCDAQYTPKKAQAPAVTQPVTMSPVTRASQLVGVKYFVTPRQLVDAYDANEVAASQKYAGCQIVVKGRIDDIGTDILGDPYITLRAEIMTSEDNSDYVQCCFAKKDLNAIAQLTKGQTVEVKGTIGSTHLWNVLVNDCELLLAK